MSNKTMTTQDSMMPKLVKFFSDKKNLQTLRFIIKDEKCIKETKAKNKTDNEKKPKLSINLINWFCINYSKQYDSKYYIKKRDKKILFHVYTEYLREAGSQGKEFFDCFCRAGKNNENLISLEYIDPETNETKYLKTTTAQLNYFRWAITNEIINYVENNIEDIYKDMKSRKSSNKNKIIDANGKVKKRQISDNVYKKLNHYEVNLSLKMVNKKKSPNNLSPKSR